MTDYTGPMTTGAEESTRMNKLRDPWPDVRLEFKDIGDPFVDGLLADADALLAVVRADLEIERMRSMRPGAVTPKALRLVQQRRDDALAALPERLKEKT